MIPDTSTRQQQRRCLGVFALSMTLLFPMPGCGRATYESRLQKTIELAKYREKLNKNLDTNTWRRNGIEIRVPKQFAQLPGPVEPKTKEGEEPSKEPVADPRQPAFLSEPLPGLLGAWKADVPLDDSDGTAPAYIYLLSNYEMWRTAGQGEQATTFNQAIAAVAIAAGLETNLPEEASWQTEKHPPPPPKGHGFVPTNVVTAATVDAPTLRLPVTVGDTSGDEKTAPQAAPVPGICKMYLAQNKDIHVLILVIVPEQTEVRQKLSLETESKSDSRIAMSLETLKVPSKKPKSGSKGGGGRLGGP